MSNLPLSRRDFTKHVTLGTGMSLAGAVYGHALAAEEAAPSKPAGAPVQNPATAEDFLLAALLLQYPAAELTPEMRAGLREGLRRNRFQGASLAQRGLSNTEAPAGHFAAFRADESPHAG